MRRRPDKRLYKSRLVAQNLGNVTLKGVNVVRAYNSKWADLWNTWNWEGWVRKQIDVSIAAGANCIKITASGIQPEDGFNYPADAVLQARIKQLCDYVQSKGAVVYWNLVAHPYYLFGSGGTSYSTNIASVLKVAKWVDQQANVVAIDICNEVNQSQPTTWSGPNYTQFAADMGTYFADVRTVTSLPLTYSVLCQTASEYTGGWISNGAGFVDFHDLHPYYISGIPSQSDLATLRAASYYKGRFLMGECGSSIAQTSSVQTTWTTALGGYGTATDSFGAVLFCAADYDVTTPYQFGMYDINVLNGRSQIITPFGTWTGKL